MSLEKCPKCGNQSLIKTPHSRIEREGRGICGHIADEYYFMCLQDGCLYDSGMIRENTEIGEKLLLPWYKRFSIFYYIDMNKRLKHNLIAWLIYSIFCYIILIPFKQWIINISISILLGCLFGFLNTIIQEIRKINHKK